MAEAERQALLARITSDLVRGALADAPIERVRQVVQEMERAARDAERLGRLGSLWKAPRRG